MEIRVNVLGKVAYKQGASRDDKAKAELYPSGEGVYAVMDGDDFVCLRVVSSKTHDDIKGDYYVYVEENWTHAKIANSINVIEHEERLKDYIDKRFDELQSSIENAKSSADSINDAVGSIKSSIDKIEKDGVGSGNGISEKTLLSAIEIVSKQK
nr:MAG TPA: Flagella accessory protein C (FlaC) [Caudoviricetes sp.]